MPGPFNKLAAIAKRGLLRDFWDLYEIGKSGVTLSAACAAYVKRFHVAESDLYHVMLGLTWFAAIHFAWPMALVWMSVPIAWLVCLTISYGWMKSGIWKRLEV